MSDTQRLLDIHEIQQVLLLYAVALDSREMSLLERVFTADARIDIPGIGPVDRATFQARCAAGLGALDATQHVCNAPLLRVEGDRAFARTYLVAQHVANAAAPDGCLLIGAWYNDELQRSPEGWRISARTGNPVWWSGNAAILGMAGLSQAFPRGEGHGAPAWLRPGNAD